MWGGRCSGVDFLYDIDFRSLLASGELDAQEDVTSVSLDRAKECKVSMKYGSMKYKVTSVPLDRAKECKISMKYEVKYKL